MDRRQFLTTTAGAALGAFTAAAPAIAQAKTKVRVGYLHTVAVDGQIWTGMDRGSFEKQGLDLELRQFNTGLEIFQALIVLLPEEGRPAEWLRAKNTARMFGGTPAINLMLQGLQRMRDVSTYLQAQRFA